MFPYDKYAIGCVKLAERSRIVEDNPWLLCGARPNLYLTKTVLFCPDPLSHNQQSGEIQEKEEDEEPPHDPAESLASSHFPTQRKYEYHITYSHSYQVPVLFCNPYDLTSGELLSQEQFWDDLIRFSECDLRLIPSHNPFPKVEEGREEMSLASVISIYIHPVLQTPFFMFHPCRTPEHLSRLWPFDSQTASSEKLWIDRLVGWLSLMEPLAVGLRSSRFLRVTSQPQQQEKEKLESDK